MWLGGCPKSCATYSPRSVSTTSSPEFSSAWFNRISSVTMDFDYHQNYAGPRLDAYEKSLLDCIQGDHMLFWRQDAVELCWSFLTPVLEMVEKSDGQTNLLRFYEAGSAGPLTADELKGFLSS